MKLLILSDSHRETEHMLRAARRERPDSIVHLGDYADDADLLAQEFPLTALCCVRGNCDGFGAKQPREVLLEWPGVKIFATHGHRYGVKGGLLSLSYAAREKGAQVALFGHTHEAYCRYVDGLWLLNPGACSGYVPTYGIVEIEDGAVKDCRVVDLYSEDMK